MCSIRWEIYFMSFERDELDGKYSFIGCRTVCELLCLLLSCLAHALECHLHCMSLFVIGQGMPVFKWIAINRWSLLATFCVKVISSSEWWPVLMLMFLSAWGIWCSELLLELDYWVHQECRLDSYIKTGEVFSPGHELAACPKLQVCQLHLSYISVRLTPSSNGASVVYEQCTDLRL